MDQFTGLIAIAVIFVTVYVLSNNRKRINWRLVVCGFSLQIILAVFILQTPWGHTLFELLGQGVERLLSFANHGASFVLGPLNDSNKMMELFGDQGEFIFVFKLIPTLIFVSALSAIAYHVGLMQRVVQFIASVIYRVMGASGSEATSNAASVLIGMLEAQLLIKPFLSRATQSELTAILAGSMACISGGIMAVYIQMGIAAEFMMAASIMAIPGALVISKMMYPEVEESTTMGRIALNIERKSVNVLDAISNGAIEGLKVGFAATAVLIAVLALVEFLNYGIGKLGLLLAMTIFPLGESAVILSMDLNQLSLGSVLGALFYYPAAIMGVPLQDAATVGGLMGTKLVVNEFVAYSQLAPMLENGTLDPKSALIATVALCGFANFGSVAILIGGVGGMAPDRRHDLARLGLRAMLCGTLASYLSASIAGILYARSIALSNQELIVPTVTILIAGVIIIYYNMRENRKAGI
ncbi:MAG TPA: NupC/NupG family nucleoside CNT transporter [Gammaproteobacteria bacterium]|nr:NupC/NupG family nucleoside CNT transporter [Gammaproteobacteria bacterium]|tara:strand:- start:517 stop:1923 length:1407 start_codon:yes stop_codon:yes gene_type:complete